jgi:UDP-N-acetylmuramoyl-tripeptide--D-alanyl-D-alanine ligase
MSAPGEMEALASIVRPAIAIITNIGTAHIGRVGSRDAIAREKRAIATYFSGNETLVIPESDDYVDTLAADVNGRVVRFGPVAQAVTIEERGTDGVRLVWQDGREIMLPLSGRHNALNALAAIRLTDVLALDRFGADPFAGRLVLPDGRSQQIPLPSGGRIGRFSARRCAWRRISCALSGIISRRLRRRCHTAPGKTEMVPSRKS